MKKAAFLLSVVFLMSFTFSGCIGNQEKVATDGSTSMEKVIGMLGESFELDTGIAFTYNPTGSGAGIRAVQEGRCDIGLSSRSLKPGEREAGLTDTILAYDGIAVIVNPENPVSNLDIDKIAGIYTGKINNWAQVGGSDMEIVTIGREAGSGTRTGFEEATGTEGACYYRQELTSSGDTMTAVSQNPSAIGYTSAAALKDNVKALGVGGIFPTEDAIRDGSYVIRRPFLLVTKEAVPLSSAAQQFFDYITADDRHDLIRRAGVTPAEASDKEQSHA